MAREARVAREARDAIEARVAREARVALHVSVIAVLLLCPLHPPLHHHTTVAAYRLGVVTWGEGSLIVQCCHVHHYHN